MFRFFMNIYREEHTYIRNNIRIVPKKYAVNKSRLFSYHIPNVIKFINGRLYL
jgi:hypothetical protein